MSKIIVFSKDAFEGRTAEFKCDVHNLEEKGFNDVISSIKVIGGPWVAYYDKNFTGKQQVFEEGKYAILEDKGRFSSLRMITDDLNNPEIQLFEHVKYEGRSVTLHKETNLHKIDFSDITSSHKVKGGVWVLYDTSVVRVPSWCLSLGMKFPAIFRFPSMMWPATCVPCCRSHRQHHSKHAFLQLNMNWNPTGKNEMVVGND